MDNNKQRFEQMGMAALLPGMQFLVDSMQKLVDDHRQLIQSYMGEKKKGGSRSHKKLDTGDPEQNAEIKTVNRSAGMDNWWSKFTPAQRKKEMARRLLVAAGKAPSKRKRKLAEKPVKKVRSAQGRYWDRMTLKQRKAEMARRGLLAGKKKKMELVAKGVKGPKTKVETKVAA